MCDAGRSPSDALRLLMTGIPFDDAQGRQQKIRFCETNPRMAYLLAAKDFAFAIFTMVSAGLPR